MTAAVASIHEGRLSWPFLLPKNCRALDQIEDPDEFEAIYTMAAEFLWRWTGQIFGVGEVTAYPVHRRGVVPWKLGSTFYGRGPYGSRHYAWPGVRHPSAVDHSHAYLHNPRDIVSVTLGDRQLEPEEYLLQGSVLVRTDGKAWPLDQNPAFEVVYTSGLDVPKGGQIATGVLACEFAMAITNDPHCSLPQRLQSVTREGVSMTVMDQFEDLDDGRTGIWLIDNWVSSVSRAPQGGTVLSPEQPRFGGIR